MKTGSAYGKNVCGGRKPRVRCSIRCQNYPTTRSSSRFDRERARFMVNSMFCDCRWRQLSTSVWYRSFGKRWKYSAASFLAAVRSRVNFSRTNGSLVIALSVELMSLPALGLFDPRHARDQVLDGLSRVLQACGPKAVVSSYPG